MPKSGDEPSRWPARKNVVQQPATEPARCARCNKDMSNYVLVLDPARGNICKECQKELQNEERLARRKAAKPPVYDIDALLGAPDRKPWDVVKELNCKLDPDSPESMLLEPEVVVRDFERFSSLVGEDFDYILKLNGGAGDFLYGLRAMRAIGATHLAQSMTKVRDFLVSRGVKFPDPLPDPWLGDDITLSDDLAGELKKLTKELKPYAGFKGGDLHKLLIAYLRSHIETLRRRNSSR